MFGIRQQIDVTQRDYKDRRLAVVWIGTCWGKTFREILKQTSWTSAFLTLLVLPFTLTAPVNAIPFSARRLADPMTWPFGATLSRSKRARESQLEVMRWPSVVWPPNQSKASREADLFSDAISLEDL